MRIWLIAAIMLVAASVSAQHTNYPFYNSGVGLHGGGGGGCTTIWTPSGSDGTYVAGDTITINSGIQRVAGSGGDVVLTSTPNIADAASDGTIVIIQGTNDSATLTLQDSSNLAGSGLELNSGLNFELGANDNITLIYDSGEDAWIEISRVDI